MSEVTIEFFINQFNELRKSLFNAIDDLRVELSGKIDTSANERRAQVDKLMREGCFQGQIDRATVKTYSEKLEQLEGLVYSGSFPESNKGKKMKIGIGKFKFDAVGFQATDIILVLFTVMMAFVLWNQFAIIKQVQQVQKSEDASVKVQRTSMTK